MFDKQIRGEKYILPFLALNTPVKIRIFFDISNLFIGSLKISGMTENTYFRESQRFNQTWLWTALLVLTAVLVFKTTAQVIFGIPWGYDPPSTGLLLLVNVIWIAVIFLFASIRLDTLIDKEGIKYRFFPFHLSERVIRWESIAGCSVELFSYVTMRRYHGIRYRILHGGWTYTIRGNRWIQIDIRNGKRVFIGTQKPDEVRIVLRKLFTDTM